MQPTITGKELDEVKGTSGRKFTSFTIAITPRITIPHSVYTNWDTAIVKALSRTELTSDVMDIATTSDEEPEFKSDIDNNTIESFSTNDDADYSDPAAKPAQMRNDLKGKAKVKGKGKAHAIDKGLATGSDSESDIQFLRAIGVTVPSTANAFRIIKPGSGSITTAHADKTIPCLFADQAMDSVAESDGNGDFSTTLVSQPESIQNLARFLAATKVTVFKRHTSTAFGTNMSQPSSGKQFKSDNYGAGMSSIPKLKVSDSEVPQAGGSMLKPTLPSLMASSCRPSALRPPHNPARNPWGV
ncbi:hypothetical protein OG21DRAFT_1491472 [Imleria badia]|nr:hypothetical protein OG21DRAFT_1491472 [Imleria badia]